MNTTGMTTCIRLETGEASFRLYLQDIENGMCYLPLCRRILLRLTAPRTGPQNTKVAEPVAKSTRLNFATTIVSARAAAALCPNSTAPPQF